MPYRFIHQPFDDGYHLADFIDQVADDEAIGALVVVVAWVKRTGVEAIRSGIERLHARSGSFRAIVGISQGGTSRQGLEGLLALADEVSVLHHPGRTFHPKLYLASGPTRALALIGSHNLTLGGATRNYEAGVFAELDPEKHDDQAFLDSLTDYITRLRDDEGTCLPLDPVLLADLIANPRYQLSDEDQERGDRDPVEGGAPPADEERGADDAPVIFRSSEHPMRFGVRTGAAARRGRSAGAGRAAAAPPTIDDAADPVVKRWFKRLPPADAQQLVGSSPSNTMTLVQAGHPIERSTYFRDVFFADCAWRPSETRGGSQVREMTTIECEMIVSGSSLGIELLDVRHTPGYDAGQANRTSELAWRDFGAYLRLHDLTGRFATVERTTSGRYRVTIDAAPTGPFRY